MENGPSIDDLPIQMPMHMECHIAMCDYRKVEEKTWIQWKNKMFSQTRIFHMSKVDEDLVMASKPDEWSPIFHV